MPSQRWSGNNSAVECQFPKLDVAGSTPVSCSKCFQSGARLNVRPGKEIHLLVFGPDFRRCQFSPRPMMRVSCSKTRLAERSDSPSQRHPGRKRRVEWRSFVLQAM